MTPRHTRSGMRDPVAFFNTLRPARQACVEQLRDLPVGGPHYAMIQVVIAAMDVAAEFFTKQRSFFTHGFPDQIGRRP